MGCPVPTPYFLQEVLLSGPMDPHGTPEDNVVLAKILTSAEVTDRDKAFCIEVMEGTYEWWNSEQGPFPSYELCLDRIDKRLQEVRKFTYIVSEHTSYKLISWWMKRRLLHPKERTCQV